MPDATGLPSFATATVDEAARLIPPPDVPGRRDRGPLGVRHVGRWLFGLMILSATYDKSGIVIGTTSISIYKVLLFAVLGLFLVGHMAGPVKRPQFEDRRVYSWIVIFFVFQTAASLLGNLVTTLPISLSSEMYYVFQRAGFLLIPLFGAHYRVPPRTVLKLFLVSVLVHDAFIVLQYAAPAAYAAFASAVTDGVRTDVSVGWAAETVDFFGLQRTSNYGVFVAAFGLVALGLRPRRLSERLACIMLVTIAVVVVALGPARAVWLMAAVAFIVWTNRTGWFKRRSTYAKVTLAGAAAAVLLATGQLRAERFAAITAILDPDLVRLGSNAGKIEIAQWGLQLFRESPFVGYGQRRFADLTVRLGNSNPFMTETHSYGLSTLVSSGLLGMLAYVVMWFAIARALARGRARDSAYPIVCGMFIALGAYNIVYDAGGLDVFACFNGLAAYYAVLSFRHRNGNPAMAAIG